MDVFTGIVTALGAAALAERLSPPVDRWGNMWSSGTGNTKVIGK
jgi:hypothetical protein